MKKKPIAAISVGIWITIFAYCTSGQATEFTYQGSLKDNAALANANYDFEFALFDTPSGGSQIGATIPKNAVLVTNGLFAVKLDFGAVFPGANRYLEIRVRLSGQPGITILSPRQLINSSPYSVKSLNSDNATNATNATQLGGTAANQYVLTGDARLSDARTPTAGSSNYIQNGTGQQSSSNFNISGDGTAGGTLTGGTVKAVTQYNIGSNRFLASGTGAGLFANSNTFTGFFAGNSNTPDPGNGTNGNFNSFFGNGAGQNNTTGFGNSFFGNLAGQLNLTGTQNSFFGFQAGNKTASSSNAFFGYNAGFSNTNGSSNALIGTSAGSFNQIGNNNSFLGFQAGNASNGDNNTFLGFQSGGQNTTGSSNTAIGASAGMGASNLTNATAIGAGANVNQSNSLILGSLNPGTNVGIGTTIPTERLHVVGNGLFTGNLTTNGTFSGATLNALTQFNIGGIRVFGVGGGAQPYLYSNTYVGQDSGTVNSGGTYNSFFGAGAGRFNTNGSENSFFGTLAGAANTIGQGNSYYGDQAGASNTTGINGSFFGSGAGYSNTTGLYNTFIGQQSGNNNSVGGNNSFFGVRAGLINVGGSANTILGANTNLGSANLNNATAIGANSRVDVNNALVLGAVNGINGATNNTLVGIGTTSPGTALDVQNNTSSVAFNLKSTAGSSTIFLQRASAIAANSSQIAFYSAGTPDFAMGTSQGSAGISDFSIYSYGTNSNVFTINKSSGNVGVGTASPSYRLHVAQDVPNTFAAHILTAGIATGSSYGLVVSAGTNVNDISFQARNQAGTSMFVVRGDGQAAFNGYVNIFGPTSLFGTLYLQTLSGGGSQSLCTPPGGGSIGQCSSSLRYKKNLRSFQTGMYIINRLKPITFDWKLDGMHDLGLGAEDVEKVDPLLVTYNKDGQVEGVKYDRIGVVLINAMKEQQQQIERQKTMIDDLEKEVHALKALVCGTKRRTAICRN